MVRAFSKVLVAAVVALAGGATLDAQERPVAGANNRDLELGVPPPEPAWGPWRRGEAVALGGEKAPACTVFAFYPFPRDVSGPAADGDAEYLADLQRRFADRGVRFVVAIGDPELPLANAWSACSVVVDTDQRVANPWGAMIGPGQHVVVCDRGGRTVFQGEPGTGLVDAITVALDGTFAVEKARHRMSLREMLIEGFDNLDAANLQPRTLLDEAGHDGCMWGLAYLVAAIKVLDGDAAKVIRKQAVDRLANEWRPLAVFADLALRGDPMAPELAGDLAAALQAISVPAQHDPFVQLAYLRALVAADRGREVGRQAVRTSKLVRASADHSLNFAEVLTHAVTPAVHANMVRQATMRAEQLGAPPRLVAAIKYIAARRCDEDAVAAKTILNTYLGETELRSQINNDAWYLMTELPTMGRYDCFAGGLIERMLEQRDAMDYFEFDTAALGMFLVGRYAEAVELQESAIAKGGPGNEAYTERLRRYKAKVASAPR